MLALAPLSAGATPVSTRKGLVVAAHPAAARVGAEILAQGGNAVDALVATAFALAVTRPQSCGLAGGGFALLYDAETGKVRAFDFREVAPAAATPALFENNGTYLAELSRHGGRSVAVPGAVSGYAYLARSFGTRPLASLVRPAAALAERGVVLTEGDQIALDEARDLLNRQPAAAAAFRSGDQVVGTIRRQPALVATLKAIGREGPRAFYEGRRAQAMVDAAAADGGVLTMADLAAYRTRELTPIEGSYRGHRIVTVPPPSAGGVLILSSLATLEKMKAPSGQGHYDDPERLHDLIEIWNRAYAARLEVIGDPRVDASVRPAIAKLLAPETAVAWAKSIGPRATPPPEVRKLIASAHEGTNTTHAVVVDARGNIAMMTTTINGLFGSGVFVPETGVLLNDEMDDFEAGKGGNLFGLVGGKRNAVAPGKTPVSTMAPTLVFDGDRPWLALGSPGGTTIATAIMQVILRVVDDGMDIQRAVSAPRIHSQLLPDKVMAEAGGLDAATENALTAMGHTLVRPAHPLGDVQAIAILPDGLRQGAADPRGIGVAVAEDQIDLAPR